MPEEKAEHLTQAQKEQLEAELAELEGPRRAEVVEAIKTARGYGDLSENFEYHAAKNEQGFLEHRIRQLRVLLVDQYGAVEPDARSDTVGIGSTVRIVDEQGEELTVEISSVGGV